MVGQAPKQRWIIGFTIAAHALSRCIWGRVYHIHVIGIGVLCTWETLVAVAYGLFKLPFVLGFVINLSSENVTVLIFYFSVWHFSDLRLMCVFTRNILEHRKKMLSSIRCLGERVILYHWKVWGTFLKIDENLLFRSPNA